MDEATWHHVKDLFAEGIALPEHERPAWLARIDPPDVRATLARLLSSDDKNDSLLDVSHDDLILQLVDEPEEASDSHQAGAQVGPYRIVRELGRGGMGTVYLAERADGLFEHRVALKVIRHGLDSDPLVERFEQERRILATLTHAHIAPLYDGGTTPSGAPYFAMEYIDGLPLTAYCDQHRLRVRARLRLFQQACAAVHYAHQNLVIHRDLKPSNLLVTETGHLKLLDFGIAKLLYPEPPGLLAADHPDPLQTQTGMRALTPAYASPEQRAGRPVSTASDVYSLGVILYELLTGQRPDASPSSEPPRPSTTIGTAADAASVGAARSASPERLRRQLAGDLDTIMLKALRLEPERRYASAEAFLDDIRRYLKGLPVAARNDTLRYRLRTFARRHRTGVAAALVAVLLAIGGGVFHSVRVRQERDVARQEARKAEEVTRFLVELLQTSNPNHAPGGDATVREALDKGARQLHTALQDQPVLRAHLLHTIGEVYHGLGLYDDAEAQWDAALALRWYHYGPDHPDVAASLDALGRTYYAQGRFDEAAALSWQALDLRRTLLGPDHPDVAEAAQSLALARRMQGASDAAELLLREAVAIHRRQPAPSSMLAQSLTSLAHVVRGQGRPADAEALHREALALRRQIWPDEHPSIADALINLAGVAMDQHQYEPAERYFKEGLAMRRRTQGADHPEIGVDLGGLARLYRETGNPAAAEHAHRKAIVHLRRTLSPHHEETIVNLYALGTLFLQQGRADDAEPLLRAALDGRRATYPDGHWLIAEAQSHLGACLTDQGRFREAEPLLRSAHAVLHRKRGGEDNHTRLAQDRLAALYEAWPEPAPAIPHR